MQEVLKESLTGDRQFQVGELVSSEHLLMAFGFAQMTVINER